MKKATKIVLSIIGTLSTLGIGSAITIGIANKDLQEKNNSENTSSFQVAYEKEQEQKNELIDLSTDETSYDRKVQLQSNLNMVDNNKSEFKTSYRNVLKPYSVFTNDNNLLIYKTLYVHLDESVSLTGKSLISNCVNYLNAIINGINSDYSIKLSSTLGSDVSYINVFESSVQSTTSSGIELGNTKLYDRDNKPLVMTLFTQNLEKIAKENASFYSGTTDSDISQAYNIVYCGTFIHEFCHFMGFDHNNANKDYLMNASSNRFGGFYPQELLALFNYENGQKYSATDSTNYFLVERNRYLNLLNYNYNFVNDYFVNKKAISNFDNKQIIEMETPTEKLLLNNKYLNYYEYQKDGVITTGPFVIVNKNNKKSIILLTNDLCNEFKKHIENVVSTKDLEVDVDYNSAKQCIENGAYNNYKVTANSKEKSVPYSSYNNIWDMWTNKKTTKYSKVPGYTYNVQSTTHWNVDGIGFCEGTDKYLENLHIQDINKLQKVNLAKINYDINSTSKVNNQSCYTR